MPIGVEGGGRGRLQVVPCAQEARDPIFLANKLFQRAARVRSRHTQAYRACAEDRVSCQRRAFGFYTEHGSLCDHCVTYSFGVTFNQTSWIGTLHNQRPGFFSVTVNL